MIAYILGELSEEEQISLEKQFLADQEMFEELLANEDELIDAVGAAQVRCDHLRLHTILRRTGRGNFLKGRLIPAGKE